MIKLICTLLWWELLVAIFITALSLYVIELTIFIGDSFFRQKHFVKFWEMILIKNGSKQLVILMSSF